MGRKNKRLLVFSILGLTVGIAFGATVGTLFPAIVNGTTLVVGLLVLVQVIGVIASFKVSKQGAGQ